MKFIKLTIITLLLFFISTSCEKIVNIADTSTPVETNSNLTYTCEDCHTSYSILNNLAEERGEAGGGG